MADINSGLIWGSNLDGDSKDVKSVANGTDTSITYSNANGQINNGAGFGGASKIAISATPVLGSTTTARSFAFWIKAATPGALGWIMTQQVAASFHSLFDIYLDTAGLIHLFMNPTNAAGDQLEAKTTSAVGGSVYKHVVITYSGSKTVAGIKFYINGASDTAVSVTATMTTTLVTIDQFELGDRGGAGSPFTGNLDAFYVFNYVLTAADASTLYNGGRGLQWPFHAADCFRMF